MQSKKLVQAKNFSLEFSEDEDQWIAVGKDFGGFDSLEFTIDTEQHLFPDTNWETLPRFIDFLEVNLAYFVQKSLIPLKSFAQQSGYFSSLDTQDITFGFLNWVQIIDNTFSANDANWQFELEFSTQHKKDSLDNIDGYGRWTITFSGKCVSGIRRITW